jgi:hypothetical protein
MASDRLQKNTNFARNSENNMDKAVTDRIETNRRDYDRLLKDDNYTDVLFNPNNGGLKATHKGHKKNNPKEETYFGGLTSIDLEKKCQDVLYKNGYSCILENENIRGANGKLVSALDSITNEIAMDVKSATKNALNYRNMLIDKNNQLEKYNSRADVDKSNSVILYFHDPSFYDRQKVDSGFAAICNIISAKGKTNHIQEILCVVSDGRVIHFRY